MAYAKGVKEVAVRKATSSKGIKPSLETDAKGTYPIWRYLYQYTIGPAKGRGEGLHQLGAV